MTFAFDVNDAALRDRFLRDEFRQALATLTAESQPRWGSMNAQQMVEHLAWTFQASTGGVALSCPIPAEELDRMKRFLVSNRPTPENFMNPALVSGLPALRCANLAAARDELDREANRFLSSVGAGTRHTHPVFGPIDYEEWHRAHYKHTHHHLAQFGLVEVERRE